MCCANWASRALSLFPFCVLDQRVLPLSGVSLTTHCPFIAPSSPSLLCFLDQRMIIEHAHLYVLCGHNHARVCSSSSNMTPEQIEAQKRSKALDKDFKEAEKVDHQTKKLLLLGAGESGKSTLFKQAQTIYGAACSFCCCLGPSQTRFRLSPQHAVRIWWTHSCTVSLRTQPFKSHTCIFFLTITHVWLMSLCRCGG